MPAFSDDRGYVQKFTDTLKGLSRDRDKGVTREDRRKREELNSRIEETRAAADQRHVDWDDARTYAEGDGQKEKYVGGMPEDLQNEFTYVNFVRGIVDHFVAALISGIGDWYVVSDAGGQDQRAMTVQKYLEAVGHRLNLTTVKREVGRDAFLLGTGITKCGWNKREQQVTCSHIDPLTFFPEANAKELDQAYFVAERHVFNADYVERLYPGIDMKRASDAGPTAIDDDSERWVTRLIEVWEVLYEFGEKMMIYTGDQVLYSGDAPYPDAYPYHVYRVYRNPKSLWGVSMLKDIMPLQDFYNRFITRLAIYMHLCINPVGHTSDPQAAGNWDTTPGSIIEHAQGAELDYLKPPNIPGDLFALGQITKENLDTVSSITEITRGERPAGVTSGIAVDLLSERADRRIALPSAEWNHIWSRQGQQMLDIIERYTTGRAAVPSYAGGQADIASIDRGYLGWNAQPGQEATRYYVVSQPGAQIALSPAAIAEQAMQAFTVNAFDDIGLLEAMKLPGRREYLERKQEQLQAMLEGQQDGMAAGVPTGAPGMGFAQ